MSIQGLRAALTKPETVRHANDQIAKQAARYQFVSPAPMLCECGNPGCTTMVPVTLDTYTELRRDPYAFLTAPGHTLRGGSTLQRNQADYWLQRRAFRLSG